MRTPEPQPAISSNQFTEAIADVLDLLNDFPPIERIELLPLLLQSLCGRLPEA